MIKSKLNNVKNLIIVESPTKIKTISRFFDSNFKIIATKGHIRSFASTEKHNLGFNLDELIPKYTIDKDKKVILKKIQTEVKKADCIYLATDPDREGEAISYAVLENIKSDLQDQTQVFRIRFNEITKSAILDAIKNKSDIDINLVNSQMARQMVDRILGFLISRFLQNKIKSRSAGRVQSIALKQLSERQIEINNFVPETYYNVAAEVKKDLWFNLTGFKNKKITITTKSQIEEIKDILKTQPLSIIQQNTTSKTLKKLVPLTTTKLLQLAANRYNFGVKKVQFIAQKLYEGIKIDGQLQSLISYIRTDSTRLNDNFIQEGLSFAQQKYPNFAIKNYIPDGNNKKQNVQDAHEAIRQISFRNTPDAVKPYLTIEQHKIYSLIYNHTLACFMQPPSIETKNVKLHAADYRFERSDYRIISPGYFLVYPIPALYKVLPVSCFDHDFQNFSSKAENVKVTEQQTQPPDRYSESSLIKKMDNLSIGRPSTYANIITKLIDSEYCGLIKRKFEVNKRGLFTNLVLQDNFKEVINEIFTAEMEAELDAIALGNHDYKSMVKKYYDLVFKLVDKAHETVEVHAGFTTDQTCPECKVGTIMETRGRYGNYNRCSRYPECNYKSNPDTQSIDLPENYQNLNELKISCFVCGVGEFVVRKAKRFNKSFFLGCNAYPKCKTLISLTDELASELVADPSLINEKLQKIFEESKPKYFDIPCPKCDKKTLMFRFKRSNNEKFIACARFPKCRFACSIECKL